MARFLDPISQSKKDWLTFTEKRKQIADDKKADADNNQRIAERKLEKNKNSDKK